MLSIYHPKATDIARLAEIVGLLKIFDKPKNRRRSEGPRKDRRSPSFSEFTEDVLFAELVAFPKIAIIDRTRLAEIAGFPICSEKLDFPRDYQRLPAEDALFVKFVGFPNIDFDSQCSICQLSRISEDILHML